MALYFENIVYRLNSIINVDVPRIIIPEQYQFNKAVPAFRQFVKNDAEVFSDPKIRSLTTKVERLRNLILDLQDDMDEPFAHFKPPKLKKNATPSAAAKQVRLWLKTKKHLDFPHWKEKLEKQGVFVFMTSKYKGWSHIDKTLFRGLAIYHSILPIIIINDSDAKKAQSFSLFHELAHLLRGESAIDGWSEHDERVERWCDRFAADLLMPTNQFLADIQSISNLENVKSIAKRYRVSPYACLVRLRQLKIIDQPAVLVKSHRTLF